jgi:hypothetical protein
MGAGVSPKNVYFAALSLCYGNTKLKQNLQLVSRGNKAVDWYGVWLTYIFENG